MPKNKSALIRYMTLDRCLRNPGRLYTREELVEACNDALLDYDPDSTGISERTIFDDLSFMESDAGYSAPIIRQRHPEERRKYCYTYEDKSFSIGKEPLNEQEMEQLKETMLLLTRFKGMPQFGWVEEILARLDASFDINTESKQVIAFDENPYLKGLEYITPLFNAIIYRKVLKVTYQSFSGKPAFSLHLHPYFLKQYNNRWYIFGWNEERESIINLSLDRIQGIEGSALEYYENDETDFTEYFDDVVGVSVDINKQVERVVIHVGTKLWPRVETKPIHGSQRVTGHNENFMELTFQLIPNLELESKLLELGEDLIVIAPESLRSRIAERVAAMYSHYSND